MKFLLDSHTHTLASGHAYCTLLEMVRAAADRGLELICITDHAPGMELTTHEDYFLNFRVIDRELYGVRVMMGAELNVMDFDGTVDLSPKLLNNLDMAIASQHIWCMPQGGGPEENTAAMVRAMDNCPKICILGHPDDGRYPLDYERMQAAAGHFVGRHDFSAFMSQGGTSKTFVREIYSNEFEILGDKLRMSITGNGFLYNMVRIIAGTLVSVGRGDIAPEAIPQIIASKERKRAGITAPPEGLVLYRITY